MTADDMRTIRQWCALIAARDVEGMRRACEENDRNGDFADATAEDLVYHLVAWMGEISHVE